MLSTTTYKDVFSTAVKIFFVFFVCKLFMKCSLYSKVQYHVVVADFYTQFCFVLFVQVIHCMLNLQ